jgi:hypothetical protein
VKVADFHGNGKPDILVNQSVVFGFDTVLTVLPGNGDGTFQAPISHDTGGSPLEGLAVRDFSGNGKLGFAAADALGGASVFSGNGDGTFAAPAVSCRPVPIRSAWRRLTSRATGLRTWSWPIRSPTPSACF